MSSKDRYKQAKLEITRLREEANELAKKAFADASAELFTSHPELESFSWKQYTPYFNDGDTCEFCAQTDDIDIVMTNGDEEEDFSPYGIDDTAALTPLQAAGKAALAFLAEFDDEDFEQMFGDHAVIQVGRAGEGQAPVVSVDVYEHD